MDLIIVVLVLLAILFFISLKLKSAKTSDSASQFNYRISGPLLSPAERSFYCVLKQAIGDTYEIHSKVRIADVLTPEKGLNRSTWQKSFNRISAKHFDFTLCDPDTLAVEKVIELNDSSHKKSSRATRDQFVLSACQSANLKLYFFTAKNTYSVAELREKLTDDSVAA